MDNQGKISGAAAKFKSGLFGILGPYMLRVSILIILALAGSSINLIIPRIIARSIDDYSSGRFNAVTVGEEFLIAAAGIFIITFLQGVLQTLTAEKVAKDLRNRLAAVLSHQDYLYIVRSNPARLLTNMTSDMDSVKMFVAQAFVAIVSSLFIIIGATILLIMINWKLALAILIIVPIIAITFFVVFRKLRVFFKKSREIIDSLNRIINESILAAALIRVLNAQGPENQKFLEKNIESREIGLSIVRLFSVLIPIVMFVSNLAVVTILALGGHFVVIGSLTLGNFAAFNSYLAMLIFPIMLIGFMSNIIASATASYNRIIAVMNEPVPVSSGTVGSVISGEISLHNVSLNYGNKPVLKNISFSIRAGSKTAIIGPTAAGKSQLLYILANIISPETGSIEFDGITIDKYSKKVFHRQVGLVFQDSAIFNMTLRENIAFSENVTEESLMKAIETAELKDFIETLPEKLDTIVAERGSSLSGGQKQRIMLARALALNPKVLLLDDFTSRVDRKTENKILCNIQNNYPDITLISVTQKIASVKHFDQIILIMEGEILATGKHKELLESSPEYIQIYGSQRSTHHYEL